jgi:DNA repair protein RecN (Recombination protein N)
MLKHLTIKNYALIDSMSVEFGPGLNILTGETGAGKSIILGAIGLILGERARLDVIRKGASTAFVEAEFEVPSSAAAGMLESLESDGADGLLLRREVNDSGRGRCFVNDSPVTLNHLSLLGDRLVDLHGQHEHQALLKSEHHLEYLDNFGTDRELLTRVRESFKKCRSLVELLDSLTNREHLLKDRQELLEFQLEEIRKADPKPGEEERLDQEEKLLKNCERICEAAGRINDLVYEGEGSVLEKLSAAEGLFREFATVDPVFSKWSGESESIKIQIQEILRSVSDYAGKIEANPQRLEELRERLSVFSRLKKKYGGSMMQVLAFARDSEKDLSQIETLQGDIAAAAQELEREKVFFSGQCILLSESRKSAAEKLERKVEAELYDLGLPDGVFRIRLTQKESESGLVDAGGKRFSASPEGMDLAEFFISLNPGEGVKPLVNVASGGEVSRIMLALKSALAEADAVPVLIFDEIDTGISGRIAHVVGKRLKSLGRNHQVVCITHLPQIASAGDRHFRVTKHVSDNRTSTVIRRIEKEERIREIAKLIGGESVTEAALASARELIQAQ